MPFAVSTNPFIRGFGLGPALRLIYIYEVQTSLPPPGLVVEGSQVV